MTDRHTLTELATQAATVAAFDRGAPASVGAVGEALAAAFGREAPTSQAERLAAAMGSSTGRLVSLEAAEEVVGIIRDRVIREGRPREAVSANVEELIAHLSAPRHTVTEGTESAPRRVVVRELGTVRPGGTR